MSSGLDPHHPDVGASLECDYCGCRTLPIGEHPEPLGWDFDRHWPQHFCPQCRVAGNVDVPDPLSGLSGDELDDGLHGRRMTAARSNARARAAASSEKPSAKAGDGLLAVRQHGPNCECQRCQGWQTGNQAAVTHGARSELRLAPVRSEMDVELAADFPHLDDRRRALLADRLARIALARTWLDDRGVVRDDEGRVFDVADKVEKWSNRAEALLAELERERRDASRPPSIVRQMQDASVAKGGAS